MAAGIAVFVSIRFSDPLPAGLNEAIARLVTREAGCLIPDHEEEVDKIVRFTIPSNAFLFVRSLREWLRREKSDIAATVGIAAGEVQISGTSPAITRSAELAKFGHPGQNLVDPAAREVGRLCLPPGFLMPKLGETQLGFGLSAEPIYQLSITGQPDDFPVLDVVEEVYGNVQEFPKSFVGRESESAELQKLLVDHQLVTIVGTGGVGKTALAHWLSDSLASIYRDGAWRVDLAKLPKGANVAMAIASDLKLRNLQDQTALERIQLELSTLEGLLWIDNCEHVIDQCRKVLSAVLDVAPRVKFLLTSRKALELVEERAFFLSPFEIPTNAELAETSSAVQLFIQRAASARPGFDPLPSEYGLIIDMCRKVDGLPLAIELAAAQVAHQSVAEISERLAEALKEPVGGAPGRHRTLTHALSWSYSLLEEKEQKFFRNLGVLVGPVNRAMILSLGKDARWKEGEAEKILQKLVQHSLIQEDAKRGLESYRLLEPVRQFAEDLLTRQEELQPAKRKFAKVNLAWLQAIYANGWPLQRTLANVKRQWPNLAVALDLFLEDPSGGKDALVLCVELYDFWLTFGPYDLAHTYFVRALAAGKSTPSRSNGDLYSWIGTFASYAGRYEESGEAFQKSMEMHGRAGNRERQEVARQNYIIYLRNRGDLELALDEARKGFEQVLPTDEGFIEIRNNYSWMLQQTGRHEKALAILQETMTMDLGKNPAWRKACMSAQMHAIALAQNNSNLAEQHLALCLECYRECGNAQGLFATIEEAGLYALRMGDWRRAAKLIGGAAAHLDKAGVGRPFPDAERRDAALVAIRESSSDEEAEAAYFEGALMSLEDLYDYARAGCSH